MKHKTKKLKEIKNLLDNFSGQTESCGKRLKNHVCFEVNHNQDIIAHISALLEVCYYALDGNGMFISPGQKNSSVEDSVLKVIEMTLNLLPHGQMYCLDVMEEILKDRTKSDEEKEVQQEIG